MCMPPKRKESKSYPKEEYREAAEKKNTEKMPKKKSQKPLNR